MLALWLQHALEFATDMPLFCNIVGLECLVVVVEGYGLLIVVRPKISRTVAGQQPQGAASTHTFPAGKQCQWSTV